MVGKPRGTSGTGSSLRAVVRVHPGVIRWGAVLGVMVGLLWPSAPLSAQQSEHPRAGEISRKEVMERVLRSHERRMMRELRLDRDQMQGVQTVMEEFRPLRYALMQERRELRAWVRDEERSGLEPPEAQRILDRFQALREREMELQEEEERRLLEILDAAQLIGLQLLREDLLEQIRRADRRTRNRTHEGQGGDDGGGKGSRELQLKGPSFF